MHCPATTRSTLQNARARGPDASCVAREQRRVLFRRLDPERASRPHRRKDRRISRVFREASNLRDDLRRDAALPDQLQRRPRAVEPVPRSGVCARRAHPALDDHLSHLGKCARVREVSCERGQRLEAELRLSQLVDIRVHADPAADLALLHSSSDLRAGETNGAYRRGGAAETRAPKASLSRGTPSIAPSPPRAGRGREPTPTPSPPSLPSSCPSGGSGNGPSLPSAAPTP